MKGVLMKFFSLLLLFLFSYVDVWSQTEYQDPLLPESVYLSAPDEIRNRKPFGREWWFYEQRAYPFEKIPDNAYLNSIMQRDEMRSVNGTVENVTWVSLGPTPGAYFNYGNISSRIVTGAYHPTNPNIMYIGPANGGVWKTVDGGINWTPLTDDQPSMAMGAIAIDPVNPDIIYAGTGEATYSGVSYYGAGLLKSTNGGATWTHITSGLPASTYFSRIVIKPGNSNYLLAALGTGSGGLYRSTNGGMTWTAVHSGRCDDVVFSPTGDTAFAVGSGIGGFRRSTDGGSAFSVFGTGLSGGTRTHFDLCFSNPAFMYAAVYGGSTVTVFKSTNYGANWSQLSSGYQGGQAWYDLYLRVNPQNPDHVYFGTIDIYRSTNGGSSFQNITFGYAGGTVHVDQHFLFFHPTDANTWISLNDGGIWRTTNNGASFVNLNQNLTLTQFYRIAASPFDAGRILGGTQDNGTQQTFSTLHWAAAYGGDGGEVCFNPFNSNFILGETQNGGIFRTTNGGGSWSSAVSGLSGNAAWVAPIEVHPNNSGEFYAARQSIFKSTNNGGSWTAISGNLNGASAIRELAISRTNPSIMYATSSSQVFRSANGGANFTNVTTGLPVRTITSVYVHPDNSDIAFLTFSGFGTSKVYKTTNLGASWINISGNLPDTPVNDIFIYTDDPANPNTYFAATDIGIFMTLNDGGKWTEIDGLPNTVIMHLDYSPSNKMLRAGTHGRGVYEAFIDFLVPVELASFSALVYERDVILSWATASETNNAGFEVERKLKNMDWETIGYVDGKGTTTEIQSYSYKDNFNYVSYNGRILYRLKQIDFDGSYEYSQQVYADVNFVPGEYSLLQNYPNPFNPATTIIYTVPLESEVRVIILNSLGQEIAELVNEVNAPGFYNLSWNAEGYASGVYFYSINAKSLNGQLSFQDTKKLLLVK
jgi:photosystem II stability/assembly factor-like uncharacterized protein